MSEREQQTTSEVLRHHNGFSKSAWDLPQLLERLEGDADLLRELLQLFQHDAPENLLKAKRALAEEDLQELSHMAHTLRGMLRTLSMNAASEIAAQVEQAARQQSHDESIDLLGQLDLALASVLVQVGAWLAR